MEVDLTQPFRYLIYDENGTLTGNYFQMLRPEHASAYFPIAPEYSWEWLNYKMNDARDGLVLINPPVDPEDPPVDPEDPPVDPEPEDPVQSDN